MSSRRHISDHATVHKPRPATLADAATHFTPRGRLGTRRLGRMNGFTCGRLLKCFVTNTGLRGFAEAAGSQSVTNRAARGKREEVRDLVRDVHLFQMGPTVFSPKEICKTYSGEPCVLFYRSLLLFSKRLRECGRNSVRIYAT